MPGKLEGCDMIIFVLTYAILALLVLSSVGSVSAEIRKTEAQTTHVRLVQSTSKAGPAH
jgi:hypothetical protein